MILITGGTGFVGSNIVDKARGKGLSIRCLVRSEAGVQSASGGEPLQKLGVETALGDILQPDTLDEAMQGVSAVIHLVGIRVEVGEATFERIHLDGTKNVVDAAKKAGVRRYIQKSALGTRADSRSRYSQTKWKAEEYVRSSGLHHTIFRPSVIFGKKDGFINLFAKQIRFSPIVPIVAGKTLFQPIWVEDVADGFLQALKKEETIGREYEMVGLDRISMAELIHWIIQAKKTWRLKIHLPFPFMRVNAFILEKILPSPPITRDQLINLEEDNVGDPTVMMRDRGIEPKRVREYLEERFGKNQ